MEAFHACHSPTRRSPRGRTTVRAGPSGPALCGASEDRIGAGLDSQPGPRTRTAVQARMTSSLTLPPRPFDVVPGRKPLAMLDLLSALPIALPKRSAAAPTPAPLLIPELLAALLSHADQLTLARASRVCALWHVSAQPILDARPLHLSCSSQSRLSSLNAMLRARPEVAERVAQVAVDLTRHVGNTTALESESRSARCLVTRCPNLVELEISSQSDRRGILTLVGYGVGCLLTPICSVTQLLATLPSSSSSPLASSPTLLSTTCPPT